MLCRQRTIPGISRVHYYFIDNSQTMYTRKAKVSIIPRDRASRKKTSLSPKELTMFPKNITTMKISTMYAHFSYIVHQKWPTELGTKEMLYEVRCLKSNEDMILALAGQLSSKSWV